MMDIECSRSVVPTYMYKYDDDDEGRKKLLRMMLLRGPVKRSDQSANGANIRQKRTRI